MSKKTRRHPAGQDHGQVDEWFKTWRLVASLGRKTESSSGAAQHSRSIGITSMQSRLLCRPVGVCTGGSFVELGVFTDC